MNGILDGKKMEGVWKFSVDDFINFISKPNATSGIKSKINAQTYQMNCRPKDGARFSLYKNGRNMRVTLTGPEDIISDIMHNYYSR